MEQDGRGSEPPGRDLVRAKESASQRFLAAAETDGLSSSPHWLMLQAADSGKISSSSRIMP